MVVMTERTTIAMSVLDRKEARLTKLVKAHVNDGSLVHKDCWKG